MNQKHYVPLSETSSKMEAIWKAENASDKHPSDEFVCSSCGLVCLDIERYQVDEDENDADCLEWEFQFCPRCGKALTPAAMKLVANRVQAVCETDE